MPQRAPRVTLAVIEDDASMLFALDSLLSASGFRVVSYTSAEHFLESLPGLKVAGIVSDLYLSGMTALALRALLRDRGVLLPMVLITGHDDAATRAMLRGAGVASYLHKPFDEAHLLREVDRVILATLPAPPGPDRVPGS